ncbi:holo-ACP synthase [Buchnera aphidicola (Mollitrichosiphum nigrofasciatum)]|uniref:holo-ACP synthase n=1 Tax=Buchnera aphidicola TaxID=9 RepID=UPI0031B862AD
MTIFGIGNDILNISRIKKIRKKNGSQFAKKILTNQELKKYFKETYKTKFLAKMFAVKEACCKALGSGIRNKINFKNFELFYTRFGRPKLKFLNYAKYYAKKNKITRKHLTITYEKKYIYTLVILEK